MTSSLRTRGVSRRTFIAGAAPLASALISGCRRTTADTLIEARRIRLVTYPANHERIAAPLQRALARTLPGTELELHRLTADNFRSVHRGDADIAFGWADRAYRAYVGEEEGRDSLPLDNLRGVALLQPVPVYLLIRAGVHADDIEGLRGLRVNLGPPSGGGILPLAQQILAAHGLHDTVQASQFDTVDAAQRLADGRIDALFASVTTPSSLEPALAAGAVMLPLDGPQIANVRRQFPFVRRVPITFEPAVHVGHTSTLGLDSLIACRSELEDELVYGFTRAFFIALPELATSEPSLRDVDVQQAAATTIPPHSGALRYYREQELAR